MVVHESEAAARVRTDRLCLIPTPAKQERIVRLLDEADMIRKLRAKGDHRMTSLIPALLKP